MKKFLLMAGISLLLASTANAQPCDPRPRPASIAVNGDATISAEPNQAHIDIGVVTQAGSAPEASKKNAERLTRVLAEVKKLLGKGDEAKTSGYALTPNYRYPKDGKPEIVGYTASNMVRIKTHTLDLAGKLIDSSMQAGANNVNRLMFTLKDEQATQLEALRQASARAKAEAIAASLGLKIVKIASITEGERTVRPIFRQATSALPEIGQAPTPVEPGTVEVRSAVTLTVEVIEK